MVDDIAFYTLRPPSHLLSFIIAGSSISPTVLLDSEKVDMDQALPACMLLVVAALMLTNYPAAQAAVKAPQLSSAHDLVEWVVKYGGQVD